MKIFAYKVMGKGSIANMALYALMCMLVFGCSAHNIADGKAFYVPPDYEYTEIKTSSFTVAAWIKTVNKNYSEKGWGALRFGSHFSIALVKNARVLPEPD